MFSVKPNQTLMAPTKYKLEKTKVGEQVLDLVIPYIHNVEDRNSVSLVSCKCYATDGITRKRVTVHTLYSNPSRLSKRFPFIESLTLKGPPSDFNDRDRYVIQITPWIEQLALEFRCLKELHIRRLIIHDEDLETLVRTRGKDLRSLKIKKCRGFSSDGLMHVSKYCSQLKTFCLKYCNQLRTFCLGYQYWINVQDGTWLHQLALNSTVLEKFHFKDSGVSDAVALTLLAKNCCNSLISFEIGACCLSKLGDAFRCAVRLEHFCGDNCDDESDLVGFQFPPNMRSLSIKDFPVPRYSIVLPFLNQIKKLKLVSSGLRYKCQCSFFKRCPNLEVLYTEDVCGDSGLQDIGKFCKKLHKLTHNGNHGLVTHVGLIALAKRCTKLECLKVRLRDISNEAIKCVGTHLKNLRKFRVNLVEKDGITDLPLDNGIRAMLMGCRKLETLDIRLWHGGLTDVGLDYIGKYGRNLRFLSLTRIGKSDAGLVKLSEGCPKLRKLKLMGCPFSEQAVTNSVFNIPSLRYVYRESGDLVRTYLVLTRPEFQL